MRQTASERSAAYEIDWSLVADDKTLTLELVVTANEELYVTDRLWDYDEARRRVPDPFGVYRFVHGESLRLVFAQAPWPSNVTPRIVHAPLSSRVLDGQKHRRKVSIALPVDEYSALARDVDSPAVLELVKKVHLVLGIRLRSTLDADPVPPPRESPEQAGYIVNDPKLVVSTMAVEALPVKRRTGYIARFPLPGEPGPGPAPMPE
jgi:hypothetical protein